MRRIYFTHSGKEGKFCQHDYRDPIESILGPNYKGFCSEWDLDLLRTEIPELCCKLKKLLNSGCGSTFNGDRYGNTRLHVSLLEHFIFLEL